MLGGIVKTFDRIVSLGPNCEAKLNAIRILRERSGNFSPPDRVQIHPPQAPSGLFDWQVTPPTALLECFRRDFVGLLDEADLAIDGGIVWNVKIGTRHPHEFPMDSDEVVLQKRYPEARSRHDYLCAKFKRVLAEPARTLFLTSEPLCSDVEAELRKHLRRYGVSRFEILAVDLPTRYSDAEWPMNWPIWDAALAGFTFPTGRRKLSVPTIDLLLGQMRRLKRHLAEMRF